ncbi:MAG: hypothetical protein QT00_C0001G0289 [archaeon GW2011_AR5]|nr:MAG: hypothetical protein QT00_C0001G0289 [archaeon GW2011_AR5]
MQMNKKAMVLIILVLTSMVFISGCAQSSIKNVEEASEAVTNVSTDIDDVAGTLQDIDSQLGGG